MAITHLPQRAGISDAEWNSLRGRYCPPCSAVENIDTHTRDPREQLLIAARALIERSDFCICDLSSCKDAEEIRSFAARAGGAKLLNIGKTALPPVTLAS